MSGLPGMVFRGVHCIRSAVTADITAAHVEQCLSAGIQAVLPKPVLMEPLLDTIRGVLTPLWGEMYEAYIRSP